MSATVRVALLSVQAFVAVTAAGGGAALIAGSVIPTWGFAIVPPAQYLEGSPFASYVVPGLLLLLVVGGSHAAAFWFGIRRSALVPFAAATGGYICLIWIFVQMIYIPSKRSTSSLGWSKSASVWCCLACSTARASLRGDDPHKSADGTMHRGIAIRPRTA